MADLERNAKGLFLCVLGVWGNTFACPGQEDRSTLHFVNNIDNGRAIVQYVQWCNRGMERGGFLFE